MAQIRAAAYRKQRVAAWRGWRIVAGVARLYAWRQASAQAAMAAAYRRGVSGNGAAA